jgi:hypothetical protein
MRVKCRLGTAAGNVQLTRACYLNHTLELFEHLMQHHHEALRLSPVKQVKRTHTHKNKRSTARLNDVQHICMPSSLMM